MWDGFWIHSYKRGTLVISCSFDRFYYREYDVVFKQVSFCNVPSSWRDTHIYGDDLFRIATTEEFLSTYPDYKAECERGIIFAIDLHFNIPGYADPHHFYIVATHIYLNACTPDNNNPTPEYDETKDNNSFSYRCTKLPESGPE